MLLIVSLSGLLACYSSHRMAYDQYGQVEPRSFVETVPVRQQYDVAPIPVYVSYDPNLAQAAAYSAAFRPQWEALNGMAPPVLGGGSNGNGGSMSAGQAPIDLKATCPKTLAEIKTQAQVDACQNADIGNLAAHMPVSK
ncbi:MAG: hypothetical protein WCO25_04055 [Candidatus Uhrbacteria bacterium]